MMSEVVSGYYGVQRSPRRFVVAGFDPFLHELAAEHVQIVRRGGDFGVDAQGVLEKLHRQEQVVDGVGLIVLLAAGVCSPMPSGVALRGTIEVNAR